MGRLLALAVVAAAALLQNMPFLPQWSWLLAALVASTLALVASLGYGRWGGAETKMFFWRLFTRVLVLATVFLLALAWATWRAELRLQDRLLPQHENVVSRVEFRVTGLVQDQGDSLRFQARVLSTVPTGIPRDIQVVWRKSTPALDVWPGQVWRAALIFRRPRGSLNPHGFDYEGHMLGRNIRAIGRVRGNPALLRHEPFDSMEVLVARSRQRLRSVMREHVNDMRFGAVLIALAIGDQDSVKAEHWDIFNKTGITHLVSISGSHVTMLAALGAAATLWGWKRLRWRRRALGEWVPAKVAAGLVALMIAWLYCLLAGWGVPARRTFFMLLVAGLALLSRLPMSASSVLCLAASIVTLIDPWSPTTTGFWLSFGAVAVLFFVGAQSQRVQTESRSFPQVWGMLLKEATRLQWLITLAMLPVLAFLFQQVSLSSPLANAVAIPVVTFIVTPLALLTALIACIPGLSSVTAMTSWIAHEALDLTMIPVTWLAQTPWLSLTVAVMPWWYLLLSVLGIAWALQPPGVPMRWVGWTLLLPALSWSPATPPRGGWQLSALDVGQGGAILIRTQHYAVLFDAGPRIGATDAGQRVIVPVMRAFGLRRLDALVVSHSDIDHAGGLPGLLEEVHVERAYSSFNLEEWLLKTERTLSLTKLIKRPNHSETCEAGQQWSWDGVTFTMLHPSRSGQEPVSRKKLRTNGISCVLHVQGAYHSALLPGDIGVKEESDILDRPSGVLRSDVVVVAHHGSLTSSSLRFVQVLGARHAIAQTGYLNRFAHPAAAVQLRWQDASTRFWRTDNHGAVIAESGPNGLNVYAQSTKRQRYWHERTEGGFVAVQ